MDKVGKAVNAVLGGKGRKAVSKDKYRFQNGSYDLDLTYITERCIAMALPGKGLDKVWRNNDDEVARFLDEYHQSHFMIFNLSGEPYDYTKFHNRVIDYGWPDHSTCPVEYILRITDSMKKFLDEDPMNVCVVHCLAGRGRTGTVVSSFLLKIGLLDTADAALNFFAEMRSSKGEGVLTPSQIRFVGYTNEVLKGRVELKRRKLVLDKITMTPCPTVPTADGWTPVVVIETVGTMHTPEEHLYSSNSCHSRTFCARENREVEFNIEPAGCYVEGDIQVKFFHRAASHVAHAKILKDGIGLNTLELAKATKTYPLICLFRFSFNTDFVGHDLTLTFRKNELDGMFSGITHTTVLPEEFSLRVFFSERKQPHSSPVISESSPTTSTNNSHNGSHRQSRLAYSAPPKSLPNPAFPPPTYVLPQRAPSEPDFSAFGMGGLVPPSGGRSPSSPTPPPTNFPSPPTGFYQQPPSGFLPPPTNNNYPSPPPSNNNTYNNNNNFMPMTNFPSPPPSNNMNNMGLMPPPSGMFPPPTGGYYVTSPPSSMYPPSSGIIYNSGPPPSGPLDATTVYFPGSN